MLILVFSPHAGAGVETDAKFTVPPLSGPVVDYGNFLSSNTRVELDQFLHELKDHGKVQLQILTVPSLNDVPIEQATIQVFDQWKLGGRNTDNGVLLLISRAERKMRIEVGRGLEGDLPDVYCKRIIEDDMAPYFRAGDTDQGIRVGVAKIVSYVDPQMPMNAGTRRVRQYSARDIAGFFKLGIFLLIIFSHLFFRRRSYWWGGGSYWGGGGWGGGGGGFGGGGWSGGGGGSSGGGASGGW